MFKIKCHHAKWMAWKFVKWQKFRCFGFVIMSFLVARQLHIWKRSSSIFGWCAENRCYRFDVVNVFSAVHPFGKAYFWYFAFWWLCVCVRNKRKIHFHRAVIEIWKHNCLSTSRAILSRIKWNAHRARTHLFSNETNIFFPIIRQHHFALSLMML